jgi:hypothetical protein
MIKLSRPGQRRIRKSAVQRYKIVSFAALPEITRTCHKYVTKFLTIL